MLISIWRRGSSLRGGAPLAISIAVIPKDHMSLKEGTLTFSVSYGVSGLTCEPDLLSYGISVKFSRHLRDTDLKNDSSTY